VKVFKHSASFMKKYKILHLKIILYTWAALNKIW